MYIYEEEEKTGNWELFQNNNKTRKTNRQEENRQLTRFSKNIRKIGIHVKVIKQNDKECKRKRVTLQNKEYTGVTEENKSRSRRNGRNKKLLLYYFIYQHSDEK